MVKVTPAKKSRAPFFLLLLVIVLAGSSAIYYKMESSRQKPIALAPGTPLPKSTGYLRGDSTAPVSIIEFGDFECPLCGQFGTVTEPDVRKRIVDAGLASFRFYDFPLPIHRNTMSASLAAACADHQGKFWEMYEAIFQSQGDWNGQSTSNPKKVLQGVAKNIGLDENAWSTCFDSQSDVAKIEAHRAAGLALGVNSTPTFVIDGQMYQQSFTYDELKKLVDSLTIVKKGGTPTATTPLGPVKK